MPEHGGRLLQAARDYGIDPAEWLDLSTGISPFGWPVPDVPPEVWRRLPEDDDGLAATAREFYRTRHVLPVAGSQAAIQALPRLRPRSRVGIIAPGYAEHAHAWRVAGHDVVIQSGSELLAAPDAFDVIVLIHPNNPGGDRFDPDQLLRAHARLARRDGWLLVDEAFMDATPAASLAPYSHYGGLIVLRSVGKFFGLAGIRAGFVCAVPSLLEALEARLGPWAVNHPARYILRHALADSAWQNQARARLHTASERLHTLLSDHGLAPGNGTAFFQWCRTPRAPQIQAALAERGILVRRFERPASLRFGLPGTAQASQRLDAALAEITT